MLYFRQSLINSTLRKVLKRLHYPLEVMLTCVRWYGAYPLSLRHVEELMQERGVFMDQVTTVRLIQSPSPEKPISTRVYAGFRVSTISISEKK